MDTYQEQITFELISNAGDAKSYSFQALREAKNYEFDKAVDSLNKASEMLKSVHNIQTDMITKEINNNNDSSVSILMAHAQDHLMMAILAYELITEMVEQYKIIYSLKKSLS